MEKSFFRMLYSDCAIFDRNSNNTKILANEAYFENLISFYENDLSTFRSTTFGRRLFH